VAGQNGAQACHTLVPRQDLPGWPRAAADLLLLAVG